ncbi:MAG TPA: carboxymuconolactone decarboxylase family protein [Acidimicrobiia bacterium]|jgi:alkylhydroperoxidase family enzyme|nr:carboxymuconolactone decarboxylase family protein [Acidimicrobiia bacterium]HEV3450299.1 carboxymuconolactone decarboxylase family protein [Acidimicrobiia bacterium]
MSRLELPPGDQPEIVRVWDLRPEMGAAVQGLSYAVYSKSQLPARVREAARMRIAELNDCAVCRGWRIPELAEQGVTEDLYAHVSDPESGDYSAPERLAIEYAERFALDHRSIDDAFFARLREHFTDPEILDLTICVGNWVAFGRLTMVLDLDEACAVRPRVSV